MDESSTLSSSTSEALDTLQGFFSYKIANLCVNLHLPCQRREFYETMALNVQKGLSENKLINEKMVTQRLVNQQVGDYPKLY